MKRMKRIGIEKRIQNYKRYKAKIVNMCCLCRKRMKKVNK